MNMECLARARAMVLLLLIYWMLMAELYSHASSADKFASQRLFGSCQVYLCPYSAQVEVLNHSGKWEADNMLKVPRVCKQIKELHAVRLTTGRSGVKTVLQGMLQLQHLRSLTVKVIDDKELRIIGEMLQLRELELTLGPKCTVAGVLQLETLKEQGQLQELAVVRGVASIILDGEWEELRTRLSISSSIRSART